MGWLRGQQTDFPGTWGEGGSSTLTHCRSQHHCIPTSTPDFKRGGGVRLHSLTADHNFTASQLQLLKLKFFLRNPSPISAFGGGGSSTLHNMSQIFSLSFCSSITGHLRESPITDFVFPAFPRGGGGGYSSWRHYKSECTLINRILKIQRCFRACSRVLTWTFITHKLVEIIRKPSLSIFLTNKFLTFDIRILSRISNELLFLLVVCGSAPVIVVIKAPPPS